LRSNINEAEDQQRKWQDQSNSILQILSLLLCVGLSIAGIIVSNIVAAKKVTEETYQIMYTVALFFAWDFLFAQTVYGSVQACLIMGSKKSPKKQLQGFVGLLVNQDIYHLF